VECGQNREASGGAPVYGYQVLQTFPHDTRAFTEGLFYDVDNENILYESTGNYGQSTVRRVNLTSGVVLQSVKLQEFGLFGEGITRFPDSGGRIYQLTWKAKKVFVRDTNSFEIVQQFTSPSKEGWGITNDGTHLIMSDGSATLWFLDPQNFTAQRTVQVMNGVKPVLRLNELEYINGQVWANVWLTDNVVVIDPASGNVTAVINFANILKPKSGDVLNGIAYDAQCNRVFVTGKYWPKLFQVSIPGMFEGQPGSRSVCKSL